MSDTPRTDNCLTEILDAFGYVHQGNCPQRWVNHARELERELNAANQRIQRLEAVVNDPEVLWSNWLRGTVKLPSGIGDVRQYQERIKRMEEAAMMALHGCYNGPMPDHVRDALADAMEAKP